MNDVMATGGPGTGGRDAEYTEYVTARLSSLRRAGLAGAPVLAAAAVAAVALLVGAGRPLPGPGPAPVSAAAPRQFNPLAPYASFGWLPAGDSLQYGGSARTLGYQVAGPSPAKISWLLQAYARGRCRLTGPARTLHCTLGKISNVGLRLGGRAAGVRGHLAFWGRPSQARTGENYLAWQYAEGGWAVLIRQGRPSPGSAWHPQAVRIADHVRFGARAAPPVAFAVRLTGVPAAWQASSITYVPDGAVLRASGYTVSAGPAELDPYGEFRPGPPALRFDATGTYISCSKLLGGKTAHEVINGHPVVLSHFTARTGVPERVLCAPRADGLAVLIAVLGKHPVLTPVSLFAHHLRLLGTNPAHWDRNPIG